MLYLLAAIISSAAMTLFLKGFQSEGTNRYAIILGNYAACVVIGLLMLKEPRTLLHLHPATMAFGLGGGILFVLSLVLMQRSIETNGAILTSAFSRMGLIVPLLISIAFLGEKPRLIQILGILLVFAAILIINGKSEKKRSASFLLLLIVLLVGGTADTMAKMFDHFGDPAEGGLYIFYVFLTAGVITIFLLLHETAKAGTIGRPRDFAAGIAVGIPNYFSASLLLKALATIPGYIAYTVFSTGVLLLITACSVLFFKEKPGRDQIIGLAVILVALVLLNLN